MTGFVLDASVTMAWCFGDEATPETWALLDRLAAEGAIVPGLWALEVGNILAQAERRNRTTAARIGLFVEQLATLPIRVDDETSHRALDTILSIARRENVTMYDAAYLELAIRLGAALATKDEALKITAARNGVSLVPTN